MIEAFVLGEVPVRLVSTGPSGVRIEPNDKYFTCEKPVQKGGSEDDRPGRPSEGDKILITLISGET